MDKEKDSIMAVKLDTYKPLREIVFESLREAIIKGELEPGKRLMEIQLAQKMGVSRTPIREAIRQLELEGLVIMEPRRGAYVAGLSMEDVTNVLEIRGALEGLAASLAAQRATKEEVEELSHIVERFSAYAKESNIQGLIEQDVAFHDIIYKSTGNERLLQLISSLREQVQRFRVAYISQFDNASDLLKEHQQILQAIQDKDGEKARKIAEDHIKNAENYMIQTHSNDMETEE